MVHLQPDVAATRKTGWGLPRCSHPDGIPSPASESSDSEGVDRKASEKLSLGSKIKKTLIPQYLVVPGGDDHPLFVFSQSGLLTLTLQFQTRLRFVFKGQIIRKHGNTNSLPD